MFHQLANVVPGTKRSIYSTRPPLTEVGRRYQHLQYGQLTIAPSTAFKFVTGTSISNSSTTVKQTNNRVIAPYMDISSLQLDPSHPLATVCIQIRKRIFL